MIAWRRQYGDVIRRRLARGDWRGLASLAARWVGTAMAPRVRRPLVGPALATLQTLREPDPTKARPDSKRRRSTEPDTKRARHG